MPAKRYSIAWIATNNLVFQGAIQVLNPDPQHRSWRVEAPRDPASTLPSAYEYKSGVVNGHTVFLVNAEQEENVTDLAGIMVSKLARMRLSVGMFFVSTTSFVETYQTLSLTPNECIFDIFPAGNRQVSAVAARNG
ncbi:hypothetical protein MKX08_003754 [Trichoderma sp. CBMAI-0020]|nr:hypothetical protein MKX08_003754 [Trichoderma sp. CBMAI-0020]